MNIHVLEQNTKEWLDFRKNKIGASDASAIMKKSPWASPYMLWHEKTQGIEKKQNANMMYGKKNEETARDLYQEMTGTVVSPLVGSSLDREWQIASFDGIDLDFSIIVEIKCANRDDHHKAMSGQIPEKYYPQVQHQLIVADLPLAHYFSFYRGDGIIVDVKRDEKYIEQLLEAESEFYFKYLLPKKAPPLIDMDLPD